MSNYSVKIMGILNITPDSFSDGGSYLDTDCAIRRALEMVAEGAAVIDVGGESTRPGYEPVTAEEEIGRVVPVIRGIREQSDVQVSIDTMKYEVAEAAIEAGATIVNDIWGLQKDERLAELAAGSGAEICLVHNPGTEEKATQSDAYLSAERFDEAQAETYIRQVCEELQASVAVAKKYGIPDERIILDPGVGFHKNYEQDLCLIRHISSIVELGYPVLMAASRKRVIGHTLDLPVEEREEGSIAIALYAASQGCRMIRVHNVKKHARALRMWETLHV